MSEASVSLARRDPAGGAIVLAAGAAIGCVIVWWGPAVATWLTVRWLSAAHAASLPVVETLFTAAIFGALIVAAVIGGTIDHRNVLGAGERPLAMLATGLLVGFAGISVAVVYARIAGTLIAGATAASAVPAVLLWGAGVVGVQTAAEEVYFRGWLQPALARRWGIAAAVLATALVFAATHVVGGARGPVTLVNLFLGGLMFGLLAACGRGLAAAAAAHFAWNAGEQLIYGLDPNPGIGSFGAWLDMDLAGSSYWGGSVEGLNASLGMTAALLAILVPLALMTWRTVTTVPIAPAATGRTKRATAR